MAEANTAQIENQDSSDVSGQGVVVADRYQILVDSPLPDLDLGMAKACVVRDKKTPKETLFVRICHSDAVPRLDILNNLKHMMNANLLRLVECLDEHWRTITLFDKSLVFRP